MLEREYENIINDYHLETQSNAVAVAATAASTAVAVGDALAICGYWN